jgi:YcxB-like protein
MKFTIEEDDYVKAATTLALTTDRRRTHTVQSWGGGQVIFGVTILGWFTVVLVDGQHSGASLQDHNWPFWAVLVFLTYFLVTSPIRYRRCLRTHYRRTGLDGEKFDAQWTETGLRMNGEFSSSFFEWKAFKHYLELEETFILQLHGTHFYVLPKRFFEADEQVGFRSLLTQHVLRIKAA